MAKQTKKTSKLSPLVEAHLTKYQNHQWCSLPDLAKETGLTAKFLEGYFNKNGGLKDDLVIPLEVQVQEPQPAPPTIIHKQFAKRDGVCMMTEGAAAMIEDNEKMAQKKHNPKHDKSIFRGNSRAEGTDPYSIKRNF